MYRKALETDFFLNRGLIGDFLEGALLFIIIYLLTAIGLTPSGSGYICVPKHKLVI